MENPTKRRRGCGQDASMYLVRFKIRCFYILTLVMVICNLIEYESTAAPGHQPPQQRSETGLDAARDASRLEPLPVVHFSFMSY